MNRFRALRNPYLIFLPTLIFFLVFVFLNHNDFMDGDEGGYVSFAKNLLEGYYSPPPPAINLWWGPGYPIFIVPFIAFKLPYIFISLANGFLQYFSIVLLFKALQQIVNFRTALVYSLIWFFCFSSLEYVHQILTEPLTSFLVALFLYTIVKTFNNGASKYQYLAGITFGLLALTKVVFGYVIFLFLATGLVLWLLNIKDFNYKRIAIIMIISFLTITPYLIYTYNLTGKWLYMGNSGGMSLFWMSNPNELEYGDWNNEFLTANTQDSDISASVGLMKKSHDTDLKTVKNYVGVEKDEAYKKLALSNIKNHPIKYGENLIANTSRMLFGFPYTYTFQRPINKVWYFAVIYFLILICTLFTLINWFKVPKLIQFLFLFAFMYLAISSMVSVGNRQFVIILPILLFWIAFIINQSISFKLKWN